MGHVILLYSIVALFGGLAVAISGKCFFNNKIMYMFGAVITAISFCICLPLLSAYILEGDYNMDYVVDTVLVGIVGGMFLLSSVAGIMFIVEIALKAQ